MTDVLTVPTAFENLQQLGEGLVDRLEEERIILYGPQGYPEGERIAFSILLADGSTALEGHGIVLASVDGGQERGEPFRYDVVLGDLHFEARHQVVFERLLLARSGGGEATGQIDLEQTESEEPPPRELAEAMETRVANPQQDAALAEPLEEPPLEPTYEPQESEVMPGERTVVASLDEMQEIAAAEEPPFEGEEPAETALPSLPDEGPSEEAPWRDASEPMEPPGEGNQLSEPLEHEGAESVVPLAAASSPPPPESVTVRPAPPRPSEPAPFSLDDAGRVLTRPSRNVAWSPHAPERPGMGEPDPRFPTDASLAAPEALPRPSLATERRIAPAPHPSRPARPSLASAAAVLAPASQAAAAVAHAPDIELLQQVEAAPRPQEAETRLPGEEPLQEVLGMEPSSERPLSPADFEPLEEASPPEVPIETTALDMELPEEE